MAIHPHRLRSPFVTLPDVRMYQIAYDGRGLTVRVVLRDHAPGDLGDLVRARLVAVIEEAGAVPPPVTVEEVADIAREPGPAGKLKLVKIVPR
ncbi:MAG TPA: hypothetical protein VE777_10215 [Gaiellales bacterium]|nr:hypothetical protein [Gaiellales bacterium]